MCCKDLPQLDDTLAYWPSNASAIDPARITIRPIRRLHKGAIVVQVVSVFGILNIVT